MTERVRLKAVSAPPGQEAEDHPGAAAERFTAKAGRIAGVSRTSRRSYWGSNRVEPRVIDN